MSTKDSRILDFQKSQKDFLRQPYANWVQSQRSLGNWRPSDGLITSDGINRVGIPAIASNTGSNVIVESDISNESNFKAGNSSSNSAGINANDDRKQSLQDKSPDSMKSIHEQAKYSMDRAINIDQKYYQLKKNTENLSHSNLKSGSRIYFDPRMQLSEQFFSQRYPSSENMSQSLGQKFQENRHLYYSSQRQNGHFSYQNLNNPTAIKPNFIISGHFKDANGREISRRVPIYPHQMNNIHTNPSDIKNNSNRPQTHPEYSLQRPSTFSGLAKQPTMHSLSIASGIQQPGSIPANENNTSTNGSQVRRCANCQTAETPSWRRCGPEQIILCNACGLYFIEHGHHRAFRIGIDGKTRALRRRKRSSPTPRSFNPIISAPDGSVSISYKEYQPKNFPDIRPN